MKLKMKGICFSVMFLFVFVPVSSQMAVVDFPHILETIHNGYQMYQSVQNSIKQLEYAYQQTQAQLKQLQQLDFSQIQNFDDAVRLVDKQIDFVRTTENRFKSISVNVGGKNIPLTQFYRLPEEAVDMVINDLTKEMSEWEKARAWSRHGLNPANYMYVQAWKGRIEEVNKQLVVIDEVIAQNNATTAEAVEGLVRESMNNESQLAVMQSMTALLQILIGEQMEANRLNSIALRYEADKDKAQEMPVTDRARFSSDWIE